MEKYGQNSRTAPSLLKQVVMRRQCWFFFFRKSNVRDFTLAAQCSSITNATCRRERWHNWKNSTRPLTLTSSCHSPHSHPSQPILSSRNCSYDFCAFWSSFCITEKNAFFFLNWSCFLCVTMVPFCVLNTLAVDNCDYCHNLTSVITGSREKWLICQK